MRHVRGQRVTAVATLPSYVTPTHPLTSGSTGEGEVTRRSNKKEKPPQCFFKPVILFLDCGETREASFVKSQFEIFKTGLPGQLGCVSAEESSPSASAQHTPVGVFGGLNVLLFTPKRGADRVGSVTFK